MKDKQTLTQILSEHGIREPHLEFYSESGFRFLYWGRLSEDAFSAVSHLIEEAYYEEPNGTKRWMYRYKTT